MFGYSALSTRFPVGCTFPLISFVCLSTEFANNNNSPFIILYCFVCQCLYYSINFLYNSVAQQICTHFCSVKLSSLSNLSLRLGLFMPHTILSRIRVFYVTKITHASEYLQFSNIFVKSFISPLISHEETIPFNCLILVRIAVLMKSV